VNATSVDTAVALAVLVAMALAVGGGVAVLVAVALAVGTGVGVRAGSLLPPHAQSSIINIAGTGTPRPRFISDSPPVHMTSAGGNATVTPARDNRLQPGCRRETGTVTVRNPGRPR
jgi:hypothetical protein